MDLLPSMIKSSGYLETRRQLPNQRGFNGVHDEINYIALTIMGETIKKLLLYKFKENLNNHTPYFERRYINSQGRYINYEYTTYHICEKGINISTYELTYELTYTLN